MTRTFRVGIVGVGFGQRVLVPAFRSDRRCEVVALCASSRDRARRVARRLNVPKAYGHWRELVDDRDIDAVAIATPPTVQPAIAIAALNRAKAVFCEKPLATTVAASGAMCAAARRAGVAHMVDFEFPEIATWRLAKNMLDAGRLGRLRHVSVSWRVQTYANRMGQTSWKTAAQNGGGVLNSLGSHIFYYIEYLLSPIQRLSSCLFNPVGSGCGLRADTVGVLCLVLADGTPVSVSASTDAFLGTGHRIEIYGERGTLRLENPTGDYVTGFRLLHGTARSARLEVKCIEKSGIVSLDGRINAVKPLIGRFVDWIQRDTPAIPNLEHGHRVQCLLDAARRAASGERWINVVTGDG